MKQAVKRLVLIVSGKGGVGKTTFARLLVDTYHTRKIQASLFDADGQVGGLARTYQDLGVLFYDLRQERERDTLLNSVDTDKAVILHDLPGGSRFEISKIIDTGDGKSVEGFLTALTENHVRLTLVHLLDHEIESAQSVGQYLETFGTDLVDHVAVLNLRESRDLRNDFPYWYGHEVSGQRRYGKARERLLSAGGVEITMPGLHAATRAKVNALNLRYAQCLKHPDLTITERSAISRFLRDFHKGLTPAATFLGLE